MYQSCKRAAAWLIAVALLSSSALADGTQAPRISAKCAIVLDCTGGRVLYEKDADTPMLIASTTKIMTALVAAENCNLDSRYQIPPEAAGIEGSSMYLQAGEIVTGRDLLYGMMLQSGNDAAVALAIFCAGDVPSFVRMMNEKAGKLGLQSASFANPNGLDDDRNHASARDLAYLAKAALENEIVAQAVASKTANAAGRTLTNHNKLLWQYPDCVGVKTGYTKAAGRILVSAARRNGRLLVAVTISDPDDWADHKALLDYGFSGFELQPVLKAGEHLADAFVVHGTAASVGLSASGSVSCTLLEGETPRTRLELPGLLLAPLKAGTPVGRAAVWVGDACLGQTPLVLEGDIGYLDAPPSLWDRLRHCLGG